MFGDYCKGVVSRRGCTAAGCAACAATGLHVGALSSFGEDGRGRVYAVSLSGPVYRLVPR